MDFVRLLYPLRTYLVVSGTMEKPNVMTADWVCPLSFDPPMLGVAISKKRYSYKLIHELKEFVISVPLIDLLDDVWKAGTTSGRNVDKKQLLSLTFVNSRKVNVPSIKECVANLECKLVKEVETGDHVWFIGEIVNAEYDDEVFRDFIPNPEKKFILHVARNKFVVNESEIKEI